MVSGDDAKVKEIIPDKCFLFESKTTSFILNIKFKSNKNYGNAFQVVNQNGTIYAGFVDRMISEKKAIRPRKGITNY